MAEAKWTQLPDRGVVAVRGADAAHFLQNLVTNDVDDVADGKAGYGALLTPQGKVLFDFIVHRSGDDFLLDTPREQSAALVQRLTMYRLRAPIEIADESDSRDVVAIWGADAAGLPSDLAVAADPRLPALGFRGIVASGETVAGDVVDAAAYHRHRIALTVPETGMDFALGDVFPHDINMDQIEGVDFAKGCYVGQEVVSRMEHRGTARRRIVKVSAAEALTSGADITADDKPLGTIGSVDGPVGIALVRTDRVARAVADSAAIISDNQPVSITAPAWARFTLDAAGDGA